MLEGEYRQFKSDQDIASEIQLEMVSQSFQDEYAEQASNERKNLEQQEAATPSPSPKKKKVNEPGDLGGTNGTLTVSEAPPVPVETLQSQPSSLESELNNLESKKSESLNLEQIKKAVWPWQHFKSDVTKYKGKLEQNMKLLNMKHCTKET